MSIALHNTDSVYAYIHWYATAGCISSKHCSCIQCLPMTVISVDCYKHYDNSYISRLLTIWENSDIIVNSSNFISSKTLPVSYQSTRVSTLNDPCIVPNIISDVILSKVY